MLLVVDYAAIVFERCDNEVTEYYQPVDLEVGGTVFVYGRRFLLLDCDAFTRKYYSDVLRKPQGNKLEVQLPQPGKPTLVIFVIMFCKIRVNNNFSISENTNLFGIGITGRFFVVLLRTTPEASQKRRCNISS